MQLFCLVHKETKSLMRITSEHHFNEDGEFVLEMFLHPQIGLFYFAENIADVEKARNGQGSGSVACPKMFPDDVKLSDSYAVELVNIAI